MKFSYSENAKKELAAFLQRQTDHLQNLIKLDSHVIGDEMVEITASDIKKASDTINSYVRPVDQAALCVGLAMLSLSFFVLMLCIVFPPINVAVVITASVTGSFGMLVTMIAFIAHRRMVSNTTLKKTIDAGKL